MIFHYLYISKKKDYTVISLLKDMSKYLNMLHKAYHDLVPVDLTLSLLLPLSPPTEMSSGQSHHKVGFSISI